MFRNRLAVSFDRQNVVDSEFLERVAAVVVDVENRTELFELVDFAVLESPLLSALLFVLF